MAIKDLKTVTVGTSCGNWIFSNCWLTKDWSWPVLWLQEPTCSSEGLCCYSFPLFSQLDNWAPLCLGAPHQLTGQLWGWLFQHPVQMQLPRENGKISDLIRSKSGHAGWAPFKLLSACLSSRCYQIKCINQWVSFQFIKSFCTSHKIPLWSQLLLIHE